MSAGEVLRRGKVAVLAVLAKPLIRGEHVGHHAEGRVCLYRNQAGRQDARRIPREEVSTLFAHLLQVLGCLDKGLPGEEGGPPLQLPMPHPSQPPHNEAPRVHPDGHDTKDPVHQLLQADAPC